MNILKFLFILIYKIFTLITMFHTYPIIFFLNSEGENTVTILNTVYNVPK